MRVQAQEEAEALAAVAAGSEAGDEAALVPLQGDSALEQQAFAPQQRVEGEFVHLE